MFKQVALFQLALALVLISLCFAKETSNEDQDLSNAESQRTGYVVKTDLKTSASGMKILVC